MTATPTSKLYKDALERGFSAINRAFFKNELPEPVFVFSRQKGMRGSLVTNRWVDGSENLVHEIALNPDSISGEPEIDTLSTLLHEACHLFQAHTGQLPSPGYHNRGWAKIMMSVGLIPSASGKPGGKQTGMAMSHYIDPEGVFLPFAEKLISKGWRLEYRDR